MGRRTQTTFSQCAPTARTGGSGGAGQPWLCTALSESCTCPCNSVSSSGFYVRTVKCQDENNEQRCRTVKPARGSVLMTDEELAAENKTKSCPCQCERDLTSSASIAASAWTSALLVLGAFHV